ANSWQWDLHSSGSWNTLHWQWELILPVGTLSWQWECLVHFIPNTADLLEMELKKILIEKMEGNKSIQHSDEQRNLYKALVDAYEADNIILDLCGETVIMKRRRDDDDDDKDEEPSTGSDRGSKRRRASARESAFAEEPVQTTFQIEEPSHPVFETGAKDQPIVQSSQHPEWFSLPKKPLTPDRD
nr:hypothetical protein [Tanacetum cinerariifolium]